MVKLLLSNEMSSVNNAVTVMKHPWSGWYGWLCKACNSEETWCYHHTPWYEWFDQGS